MAEPNNDKGVHVDADAARAGSTPGVARYVLGISLLLVIVGFVAVYLLH